MLWYGEESDGEGRDANGPQYGGRVFVRRMAAHLSPSLLDGTPLEVSLGTDSEFNVSSRGGEHARQCPHVRSVHGGSAWAEEPFMLGPMSAVLAIAPEAQAQPSVLMLRMAGDVPYAKQQAALDKAAEALAARSIHSETYYSAAWIALSTATLSGELPSLGPLLRSLRSRTPPRPPLPLPPQIGATLHGKGPPPPPPEDLLIDRMEHNLEAMHEDNQVALLLLLLLLLPLVLLGRSLLLGAARRRRHRQHAIPSFAPCSELGTPAEVPSFDDMDSIKGGQRGSRWLADSRRANPGADAASHECVGKEGCGMKAKVGRARKGPRKKLVPEGSDEDALGSSRPGRAQAQREQARRKGRKPGMKASKTLDGDEEAARFL